MNIVVLEGDGIGPEIISPTVKVGRRLSTVLNLDCAFELYPVGLAALSEYGTTFPTNSYAAARESDGILLGPLSTASYPSSDAGGINASAYLRQHLDLFANVRPCRTVDGVPRHTHPFDLCIVRENTEGFYAVRSMVAGAGEFAPGPGMAFALRKVTASASRRIAIVAFDIARRRSRKVTAVSKSNVLEITDGLFLRECRSIAGDNPEITYDEMFVDTAAAQLATKPGWFDVIVTTNLFGDILSNEAAALAGGLGMAASLNYGSSYAMAQATHGSAPDIAGKGLANPISTIVSLALLFEWYGYRHRRKRFIDAYQLLMQSVDATLKDENSRTIDIGGKCTTSSASDAILGIIDTATSMQSSTDI